MRLMLLPLCSAAAIAAPTVEPDTMLPGYREQAQRWSSLETAVAKKECADRIEQVRSAAGQPRLDHVPASAERPLLIAAVDKRIDDCPVMVMRYDINDLRPLPAPAEGPVRLEPAR
ncbi:hypothetical protein GCM10011515_12430 [Tsuneonella deserti]|uniref:UrcA family protein n=1 Tax=Tsuneonella deserti TaxID=2035528 RepID=A0ABQ1S760_9SPHN|nr:hypothetical protein [Tsuneonella deserti]GGD94147.1 hypothetical protein GCM10011515_12430 [Tsuneonella deserti]